MATKRKEHPKKNQNDNKTHCFKGHEFTQDNTYVYSDGSRHCRACSAVSTGKYREKNKESVLEYQRLLREEMKRSGLVFPSQTPEAKKRGSLVRLGWTLEMFNLTLSAQGSRCAICDKPLNLDKVQNEARACADHAHSNPPTPRGVLCTICNAGLGHFRDNPGNLRKAADYLEKFC